MGPIQKEQSYEEIPVAEFVDIILGGGERADEAMYYLLHKHIDLPADSVPDDNVPSSILTDERKLAIVSHLIAYAHQELSPRDCFIFLRSMLTKKSVQIPISCR